MNFFGTPWSLRSEVERAERDWRRSNRHRKRLALTYIERELLLAGEHPLRFVFSLLRLQLVVLLLLGVVPSEWLSGAWYAPPPQTQWSSFTSVWSIQATVVALVYPIVIAFVTLFLQRRPAAEAFVHLYVFDSGALAAGLSSLALVTWMGIQYILLEVYGATPLTPLVLTNTAWLVLNMVLTSRFLIRTVLFLRREVQSQVVHRYVVNVALPKEISEHYAVQLVSAAQANGWLPFPISGDNEAEEGPRVLVGASFREGEPQGERHVRKPSRLVDVRIWLVRAVVATWYRAARKRPRRANVLDISNGWPLLVIPAPIGATFTDSIRLAHVLNGPALRGWQRCLLRHSFILHPVSQERYVVRPSDILLEMASEAREAASRGDSQRFEQAYEAIIEMHKLLIGACLIEVEGGQNQSWALLSNEFGLFYRRALHEDWLDTYRPILEAAIENMANDTRPVRRFCYLLPHLSSDDLRASPAEVQEYLLRFPPLMMFLLERWWTHRVEEQGDMAHSAHRLVELRLPLNRVYDEVLSEFVAGWEGVRRRWGSAEGRRRDGIAWNSAPRLASLNSKHIEETARMLLAAVHRGDRAGAEWLADVLSKWWSTFDHDHEPYQLFGRTAFITLQHLHLDWHRFCAAVGIQRPATPSSSLEQSEDRALQYGAYLAALRNYWTDIRLLTIELLIAWVLEVSDAVPEDSLALAVLSGLLTGKEWKSGGRTVGSLENLTAVDYLTAKARQYGASIGHRDGYIERLDKFVQSIGHMNRPSMVPGRPYMIGGPDGVESLQDAQLALFGSTSTRNWGASRELQGQLAIWLDKQPRSAEILSHHLSEWLARLNASSGPSQEFLTFLRRRLRPTWDTDFDWRVVEDRLRAVRASVEDLRAEFLSKQPIDPERLTEIGRFASANGFSTERGKFPMQFFQVESSSSHHTDFTLTIPQVRKGELTRLPVSQPPSNEAEYYAGAMAHQVAMIVLGDALRRCAVRDAPTADAVTYWQALKAGATKIVRNGGHPLLIVSRDREPQWLVDWRYVDKDSNHQRPEDLRVHRQNARGHSYVCDFNEIAVYRAPIPPGQSFLLSRETFRRVTFRDYGKGRFVDVEASDVSEGGNTVDLKLRFSRHVEVGGAEVLRLLHTETEA